MGITNAISDDIICSTNPEGIWIRVYVIKNAAVKVERSSSCTPGNSWRNASVNGMNEDRSHIEQPYKRMQVRTTMYRITACCRVLLYIINNDQFGYVYC